MGLAGRIALGLALGLTVAAASYAYLSFFAKIGGSQGSLTVDGHGDLAMNGAFTNANYTVEVDRDGVPYGAVSAVGSNGTLQVSRSALHEAGLALEDGTFTVRAFDEAGQLVARETVQVGDTYVMPRWTYPALGGAAVFALPLVVGGVISVFRRRRTPSEDGAASPPTSPPTRRLTDPYPATSLSPSYDTWPRLTVTDGQTRHPIYVFRLQVDGVPKAPDPIGAISARAGQELRIEAAGYTPAVVKVDASPVIAVALERAKRIVTVRVQGKASKTGIADVPVAAAVEGQSTIAHGATEADGTVKLTLPATQLIVGTVLQKEGFENQSVYLAPDQTSCSLELAFEPLATAAQSQLAEQVRSAATALVEQALRQDAGLGQIVKQTVAAHLDAVEAIANVGGWFLRTDASPSALRHNLLEACSDVTSDLQSLVIDKSVLNEVAARPAPLNHSRGRPMPTLSGILSAPAGADQSRRDSMQRLEALDHAITDLAGRQPTNLVASWHTLVRNYATRDPPGAIEARVARALSLQARVAMLENLVRAVSA